MQYGLHGPEHRQLVEEGAHLHFHSDAEQHLHDGMVDVIGIGAVVLEYQTVGMDRSIVAEPVIEVHHCQRHAHLLQN